MKKGTKILLSVIGAAVVVLGALYTYRGVYYQSHFLPGTKVEGVDISKLSYPQAKQKVAKTLLDSNFTLYDQKTKLTQVSGKELGITQNSASYLKKVMRTQNSWLPTTTVKAESTTNTMINIDQQKLNQYVDQTLTTLNQGRQAPQDAKIVKTNDNYQIKPEVAGQTFDKAAVTKAVKEAVSKGQPKVQLADSHQQAKVTKNDAQLTEQLSKIKKIDTITGKYTIAGKTETITPAMIHQWLGYSDGKITLDQTAMKAYLSSLNDKYATYNKSRQFKSTKRGVVTVPAGIYGWSINSASELPKLTDAILAGKDFTREPVIVGTGYSKDGYGDALSDIGNTYIEVDKQNQHMWVYMNGQLKIDTDVVTGNPNGHDTPVGVWAIWAKERNSTLRGENDNGSKYASKVAYWMPIDDTGVGIHDSPWQPQYGGDWYKTHGSHGCINTPPATVAKIFNMVSTGMPVVVF